MHVGHLYLDHPVDEKNEPELIRLRTLSANQIGVENAHSRSEIAAKDFGVFFIMLPKSLPNCRAPRSWGR